jgi:hypothetical protein
MTSRQLCRHVDTPVQFAMPSREKHVRPRHMSWYLVRRSAQPLSESLLECPVCHALRRVTYSLSPLFEITISRTDQLILRILRPESTLVWSGLAHWRLPKLYPTTPAPKIPSPNRPRGFTTNKSPQILGSLIFTIRLVVSINASEYHLFLPAHSDDLAMSGSVEPPKGPVVAEAHLVDTFRRYPQMRSSSGLAGFTSGTFTNSYPWQTLRSRCWTVGHRSLCHVPPSATDIMPEHPSRPHLKGK